MPFLSKLCERVLKSRLLKYLEPKFIPQQHGFRSRLSCETAVASLTQELFDSIDKRNGRVLAVFIDLRKAFDTVSRPKLMRKLMHIFKVPYLLVKILNSYLSERKFVINNEDYKDNPHPVFSALPQGSILSPMLFSAFINDVTEVLDKPFVLYADDLVFYTAGTNINEMVHGVENTLENLNTWLETQGLTVNFNKTKCMVFQKTMDRATFSFQTIKCRAHDIERVTTFKYLGVTLDCNLSFKVHASQVCNRTAAAVCKMHSLKRFLPLTAFKMLTNAFVHSIGDFCLAIWGAVGVAEMERIQKKN